MKDLFFIAVCGQKSLKAYVLRGWDIDLEIHFFKSCENQMKYIKEAS